MKAKWFNVVVITILLVIAIVPSVAAAPKPPAEDLGTLIASSSDDAPHPLGTEQRAEKALAIEATLHGKSDGDSNHHTHKIDRRHYVELDRLGEDTIWTIIAEFGNQLHPVTQGTPGPLHNQIPQPDRS